MAQAYLDKWQWALHFQELFNVSYSDRLFHSNFGVSLEICARLWAVIQSLDNSVKPDHLLYFLCFIKSYDTFDNLATKFGVTEKTFRTNTWIVADVLSRGLDTVCSFLPPPPQKKNARAFYSAPFTAINQFFFLSFLFFSSFFCFFFVAIVIILSIRLLSSSTSKHFQIIFFFIQKYNKIQKQTNKRPNKHNLFLNYILFFLLASGNWLRFP